MSKQLLVAEGLFFMMIGIVINAAGKSTLGHIIGLGLGTAGFILIVITITHPRKQK